jgi:hypothetical protein
MTTMAKRFMHLLPPMAVVLVGLLLWTCVTALAAVGSPPTGPCGPATAEEISSGKAPLAGLWAPVQPTVALPIAPSTFTRFLPPIPSSVRLDLLWGNFVSRAPPLS